VWIKPNVRLEASILGFGYDVLLGLQMPRVSSRVKWMSDVEEGLCNTNSTSGASGDWSIGFGLAAEAGKISNPSDPIWSQTLFEHDWPMDNFCIPFEEEEPGKPREDINLPDIHNPTGTEKPKTTPCRRSALPTSHGHGRRRGRVSA
jgi:hypothetical protein